MRSAVLSSNVLPFEVAGTTSIPRGVVATATNFAEARYVREAVPLAWTPPVTF